MTQNVQLNTHALPLAPNTVNNRDTKSPNIWEILHISKDVQESAKVIGDVVGAVSTVVSWVGTVQSALKLVGFIKPEPNPFDTLYQRIQNDLKQLLTSTLAGATEERLRDVAEQLAIARTAAQNANEYILLGQPNDEFQINRLAIADRDSLQVMNLLAAPEWWLRSFDPSPAAIIGPQIVKSGDLSGLQTYDYWWHPAENDLPASGYFDPPSPSNGLIWDYRHILPVYLQAVAARLVVLRARAATTNAFLQLAKSEVPGYVAFLNQQYSRIKESILVSKPPLPHQGQFPPFTFSTGAVEINSGTHIWGFWHPFYADPDHPLKTYDENVQVYKKFVAECWWQVYEAVGLGELQRVIDDLSNLCGLTATISFRAATQKVGLTNPTMKGLVQTVGLVSSPSLRRSIRKALLNPV
jgi:hypothetical protein